MDTGLLADIDHLLFGHVRFYIGQIIPDTCIEQIRELIDECDGASQALFIQEIQVRPVKKHQTGVWSILFVEQFEYGALPAAAASDQGRCLAGLHNKA